MKVVTATSTNNGIGPLTQRMYGFVEAQMKAIAAGITQPADWDGMLEFIDPGKFKRVGAYLEELNWPDYRNFLTGWTAGGTKLEYTEFQVSEVGDSVFQGIEERHWRGEEFIKKNVMAVFKFNENQKIVHVDIYEQASDSGDWIKESARKATANT